jgi:toxin ParE1/3/4
MTTFNLTPRAKEDLRSIWHYTVTTWNEAQADKYITTLYNRFQWLAENPKLGKHRPDIQHGYYCYREGSHLVFFTCHDEGIAIIGVPHQSMDYLRYFD